MRKLIALAVGLALCLAAPARAEQPPAGANDFDCVPSAAHPRPVVLVHGLGATMAGNWSYMSPRLANAGYCVFALTYGRDPRWPAQLNFFGGGTIPMQESAKELDAFVDRVLAETGAEEVDLIGHSEGTAMPRWYLERLGGAEEVNRFVALTPLWRGTQFGGGDHFREMSEQWGYSQGYEDFENLFFEYCGSCPQMIAGSDYLNELNADGEAVPGVEHFNIVTRYDELVRPPSSGLMRDGGTNIILQDLCPANLSEHVAVAFDPAVLALFKIALDPDNPVRMPAGCRQPDPTRAPPAPPGEPAPPRESAPGPLGLTDCEPVEGVHQCTGLVETWDGVPLETTVTLPAEGARRLPLLVNLHGFGNSRWEYLNPDETAYTDNAYAWAKAGYAVLTYTSRGLWGSCGTPEARLASPEGCARGYIHLADVRYEGRDTQELIGRLVDEGIAHPGKIGVTGDSYGGGQTLMLAALSDRMMTPDGRLVPWRSPQGRPLRLAAAAPVIPWSDLIYAAAPNGLVAANRVTGFQRATSPVGVEKLIFVNGIFAAAQTATGPGQPLGEPFVPGRPMGFLAPGGVDPEADVAAWVARTDRGEPYTDAEAQAIVELLARYHSAYYIPPSSPPPPLLLASGFTDDLFPVDETLRYANRSRRLHPDQPLSLLLGDFGHQRAANKPEDRERLLRSVHAWMDRYVKGERRAVGKPAVAFVQTCPREEPSIGPISARSFKKLAPRRQRTRFDGGRTVTALGGDPAVAQAIEPISGKGSCAVVPAAKAPGTATYDLVTVERRPLTSIGSLRVKAELEVSGAGPGVAQIASRLWDVAPGGRTQRLVARGTYRPHDGANVWHLHPGSWRFKPGHTAKLELLGNDAPYARPSNGDFSIEIGALTASLPIR